MTSNATTTALKRWSCINKQLPDVQKIKSIHIYDFDNTLFRSPSPNKQLWHQHTVGQLARHDWLHEGGWWHAPSLLAATGEGIEKEEARGFKDCWNENVVELARMTMADSEALAVLLTGRGEAKFSSLLQRVLRSKGLDFDMVCLKPAVSPNGGTFPGTLQFKQALIEEIMTTYTAATDVKMYEDRPKHTAAFRSFFESYNATLASTPGSRARFSADVVQVTEGDSSMDPVTEVAEVQRMVNVHNQAVLAGKASTPLKLKRNVLFTGYLTSPADAQRLRNMLQSLKAIDESLRWLGNSILITPRPAPQSILTRVGGMGARMRWRVTQIGNSAGRIWAAQVEPIPPNASVYVHDRQRVIVLALAPGAKPADVNNIRRWQPVTPDKVVEFDTVVGERILIKIEEERRGEDEIMDDGDNVVADRHSGKRARDDDFPPLGPAKPMNKSQQRASYGNGQTWNGNRSGGGIGAAAQRGNRNNGRGGRDQGRRGGNDRGGRGRGGRGAYAYRSLDANVAQNYSPSAMEY